MSDAREAIVAELKEVRREGDETLRDAEAARRGFRPAQSAGKAA
jgi:hypothetical protein